MFKVTKSNSIPNLRKKRPLIDLKTINIQFCMVLLFITAAMIFSVLMLVATPNSNFPAGI